MRIKIQDNNFLASRSRGGGANNYGGFGGMVNHASGQGTSLDKSCAAFFTAGYTPNKYDLENLYVQSWACQKFIDIPVDDMFIRPRMFKDMDEKHIEELEEQQKLYEVYTRMAMAMKAGRLYGSGMILMITKEAPLENPMMIDRLRPGDLLNLLVVDRYDSSVIAYDTDPTSLNFGNPDTYRVNLRKGGSFNIHHTRVIRFDGRKSPSMCGWEQNDQYWGISEVIPVVPAILQEHQLSGDISYLTTETSIPVVKISDFYDAIAGGKDADLTLDERGATASINKSIYRTMYMDSEDSFERHNVNWSGLPDLMDRYAKRLAAAADIPATRFYGQSPLGMNSTGEGDAVNYAMSVSAEQNKKLKDPFYILDKVMMKNAGIETEVFYDFPSLIDMSDSDKAEIANKKADTVTKLVTGNIIDENEARGILDGDEVIGVLEELDDIDDEPDDDEKELMEFMRKSAINMVNNAKETT